MKNLNTTILVLGAITIAEMIITGTMLGSFGLWFCYGVYRLFTREQ